MFVSKDYNHGTLFKIRTDFVVLDPIKYKLSHPLQVLLYKINKKKNCILINKFRTIMPRVQGLSIPCKKGSLSVISPEGKESKVAIVQAL